MKRKILILASLMACSMNTMAKDTVAVEWAPFIKSKAVTDKQLINAAIAVNSEFLIKQPGFIKRELVKKSKTEYADIIHWNSKAEAIAAGEKVFGCAPCNTYFSLMNMEASSTAGAGFSHYEVLKRW